MSKGYVYILSNPCMPGILKVGKTTRDPESRACELYQTGVPAPFKVEHSVLSPDCSALEEAVHSALAERRVSASREFFCASLELAVRELKSAHWEVVEEWLNDFMPGHIPAMPEMMVEDCNIHRIADELNDHPFEVAIAMGELTAAEVAPAMVRWKADLAARQAKRQEATH